MHFAGRNLGHASSLFGIPIVSDEGRRWFEERTGEVVAQTPEDGYDLRTLGKLPQSPSSSVSSGGHLAASQLHGNKRWRENGKSVNIPPRALTERMFLIYDSVPLRSVFSVAHKSLFLETIDRAYNHAGESRYGVASARAAIFSFIALFTIFCPHEPVLEELPFNTQEYVGAALKRYPYLMSEMTLDGLQTHMVLVSIYPQVMIHAFCS